MGKGQCFQMVFKVLSLITKGLTCAAETTLSADHILTWSPELRKVQSHISQIKFFIKLQELVVMIHSNTFIYVNLFFGWDVAKVRLGSC